MKETFETLAWGFIIIATVGFVTALFFVNPFFSIAVGCFLAMLGAITQGGE